MIKSLYNKYFQKSKSFLYPLLGISKINSKNLVETYIQWEDGGINFNSKVLLCIYKNVKTKVFKEYEKETLLSHSLYIKSFEGPSNTKLYLFDLSKQNKDWDIFLKGNYSKFSEKTKLAIRKYYGIQTNECKYIDTYLYPNDYRTLYAELLNVDIELLEDVQELCDLYDLKKESIKFTPIIVETLD
jgi:hypothetical protein